VAAEVWLIMKYPKRSQYKHAKLESIANVDVALQPSSIRAHRFCPPLTPPA
jgi:hypothetical protein